MEGKIMKEVYIVVTVNGFCMDTFETRKAAEEKVNEMILLTNLLWWVRVVRA